MSNQQLAVRSNYREWDVSGEGTGKTILRAGDPAATGPGPKWLYPRLKRSGDVVVSLMVLLALCPLLLGVAAAIKLTSRGPILYSQARFGRSGRVFQVLKFRTMYQDRCDLTAAVQTSRDDPRITVIGKHLRIRDLDELPQLLNVLKGDMSLVGPRPHPIRIKVGTEDYERVVPDYHKRHAVRPGITGLAQISGFRGPVETREHARGRQHLDLKYVRGLSLALDTSILLRTVAHEVWLQSGRAAAKRPRARLRRRLDLTATTSLADPTATLPDSQAET